MNFSIDKTRTLLYNCIIKNIIKGDDETMTTRALSIEELKAVLEIAKNGNEKKRPNKKLYFALMLQANTGLRIGDVLELRLKHFQNGCIVIEEQKTGKLQYRELNPRLMELVKDYAIEEKIEKENKLFNKFSVRVVQKHLKEISEELNLTNISTHSFRKFFANMQYENNNHDIQLLKELLNHSSIATTQRYLKVSQEKINEASKTHFIE